MSQRCTDETETFVADAFRRCDVARAWQRGSRIATTCLRPAQIWTEIDRSHYVHVGRRPR